MTLDQMSDQIIRCQRFRFHFPFCCGCRRWRAVCVCEPWKQLHSMVQTGRAKHRQSTGRNHSKLCRLPPTTRQARALGWPSSKWISCSRASSHRCATTCSGTTTSRQHLAAVTFENREVGMHAKFPSSSQWSATYSPPAASHPHHHMPAPHNYICWQRPEQPCSQGKPFRLVTPSSTATTHQPTAAASTQPSMQSHANTQLLTA